MLVKGCFDVKAVFLAMNASYTHTSLSLRYIYTACVEKGVSLECIETNINERAERIAELVAEHAPSVVLCSVYIWNARLMSDVCTRLRLMLPTLVIIWGGPEVSFSPNEVLCEHQYVDYLCLGEGERVVPALIGALTHGIDPIGISGVCSRAAIIEGRPIVDNLDELPDPYAQEESFSKGRLYYFETSRGCPYSCAYCLSSAQAGVRFMSIPMAKARLQRLSTQVELVKFVDRTFNASPARARELWNYMINLPGNCRFHFEICAHLLEEQDFEILSRPEAVRFQFEVGLQSTYEPALTAINRTMDTTKLLANVARLLTLGTVEVHVDLIAGLPGESLPRFLTTFDEAMSTLPHRLHLGFLKLLPGTSLRRDSSKHGYAFLPFAPYEVLRSSELSAIEFLHLKHIEHNLNRYYNSGIATNTMRYALSFIKPSVLFTLLPVDVSVQQWYESLGVSLWGKVLDDVLLQDLLRFDFCLGEPHRRIPETLEHGPGDEDKALREMLYGDEQKIYNVLPHRRGEKPGHILRALRLAYFRPATLEYLGLGEGTACIFDYSLPPSERTFVIQKTSGSQL